jgi:hypothetical protein
MCQWTHAPQKSDDHHYSNARLSAVPADLGKGPTGRTPALCQCSDELEDAGFLVMPLAVTDPTALNWKRD